MTATAEIFRILSTHKRQPQGDTVVCLLFAVFIVAVIDLLFLWLDPLGIATVNSASVLILSSP